MPHRIRPVLLALATALAALALPAAAFAALEQSATGSASTTAVPDRVIVVWEDGVDRSERAAIREDADTDFVRTLGDPQFQLLSTEPGQSVTDALAALRDDPAVEAASRDTLDVLHATTNDPLFGQLWGLQNLGLGIGGATSALAGADVDALTAWDRTRGIPSVVIADLDSGYRFDAADLAAVTWDNPADPTGGGDNDGNGIVDDSHGADFVGVNADSPSTDGNPTDDNLIDGGHGLHTAGTMGAAGNNGIGISGVAQDVRIMPLRVCAYSPINQETRCPTSSQINAINYAGSHGARAATMSLGGTTFSAAARAAFAANPGTLYVISAGNDTQDNDLRPHYPCNYNPVESGIPGAVDNILCVAATDQADQLADFSDWGARSVDLSAPGTEILSTYPASTTPFSDDYQVNDFASKWTATGANGGFARTNEAPLSSFGISDSPGVGTPVANTVRESTSVGVTLPAGTGACQLTQTRLVSTGGGDTFHYYVLSDGIAVFSSNPITTSGTVSTVPITGLGGTRVQVRFRFTAGATPVAGHGAWLDDVSLDCNAPFSTPPGYDFLDGTSMAAPHVTGAAGLLFSLKPAATVAEVKSALLSSVDAAPATAGRTVTGGRLNAAAALNALVPLPPPPPPPPVVNLPVARAASTRCVVPRLRGLSLSRARRALSAAHCRLGRVTRPRARRGRRLPPLVVRSSRPGTGAVLAENASVAVTLKVKPPRRARRRARRRGR